MIGSGAGTAPRSTRRSEIAVAWEWSSARTSIGSPPSFPRRHRLDSRNGKPYLRPAAGARRVRVLAAFKIDHIGQSPEPIHRAREKHSMAKTKFRPLHDRVVVKRIDADEKSKGGIIIPDTAKEKLRRVRSLRSARRSRRVRQDHRARCQGRRHGAVRQVVRHRGDARRRGALDYEGVVRHHGRARLRMAAHKGQDQSNIQE